LIPWTHTINNFTNVAEGSKVVGIVQDGCGFGLLTKSFCRSLIVKASTGFPSNEWKREVLLFILGKRPNRN